MDKWKIIHLFTLMWLTLISNPLCSVGAPLEIAVDNFSPPFVSRGANNQIYGFDIAMMDAVCRIIDRTCVYRPMVFAKLINAVVEKKTSLALGAIIITAERAEKVNFTLPYLVSKSVFIGRVGSNKNVFHLDSLNGQSIGAQIGSVYPQVINSLGIINPKIVLFNSPEEIVEGLLAKEIDYGIMDAPAAMYWQSQASELVLVGAPFEYGFGLGIAVGKEDASLLGDINRALLIYQDSRQFTDDYNHYLNYF